MRCVQLNIFGEQEEVAVSCPDTYENFVKKFEVKKTTDDCYTPPGVFDAVISYVNEYVFNLANYSILRPFKPGGNYLTENYTPETVVIDNPPFSIYRKIIRNYLNMNVKFFLFAPSLTMFVPDESRVSYYVTNSNIIYQNGARVRTGFITNLRTDNKRVILSGILHDKIKAAQTVSNKFSEFQLPENLINSAKLQKFVISGEDNELETSNEFLTDYRGRRIFGAAIKLMKQDIELLNKIKK